jgi:hypothetical protein
MLQGTAGNVGALLSQAVGESVAGAIATVWDHFGSEAVTVFGRRGVKNR